MRTVPLLRLVLNVTQWGDIEWHCLHYLKGGTGRGVKRHRGRTSCTKAPVPSVRHRPALYKVQHEGTVSAPEYRHLRTPPSSAPPATEPETPKRQWWKIFFFGQIFANIVRPSWYNLCPMSNEFAELTSHLARSKPLIGFPSLHIDVSRYHIYLEDVEVHLQLEGKSRNKTSLVLLKWLLVFGIKSKSQEPLQKKMVGWEMKPNLHL